MASQLALIGEKQLASSSHQINSPFPRHSVICINNLQPIQVFLPFLWRQLFADQSLWDLSVKRLVVRSIEIKGQLAHGYFHSRFIRANITMRHQITVAF